MMLIRLQRDSNEDLITFMDMHTLIEVVRIINRPVHVYGADVVSGFMTYGPSYRVTYEDRDFMFEDSEGVKIEHNLLDLPHDLAWYIDSIEYPEAPKSLPVEPFQATKNLPTGPGTYWVWGRRSTMKGAKHFTLRTVNLEMHNGFMRVADNMTCGLTKGLPLAELKGMSFAGPIPTPVGVI